ncbi:transmembrane emp24 domain-containing protein 5-like [Cydia pomonella]|uniref:transmembrane emp24 domain-containing protein 5-like n=1 Tax=Cydia pomonella TaxID=82600 RepID=UPI002ADE8A26|nr:transmembrane emp24 domain-containing protein 5-like [Cydia pomonella]XP_061728946.1 transmembrane emp24 domain-containing protein 5-like [Cydia pomonella]
MYILISLLLILRACAAQVTTYETDMNFRVEAGDRTCFFEKGKAGQILEASYQVIDGQHGDLDISFDIVAPDGQVLASDYKQPYNSLIMELEQDGDYVFCLDNTFSRMNSKLVFVYVMIEDKVAEIIDKATEQGVNVDVEQEEVLEWTGTLPNGEVYYMEVAHIADSLTRTLKHVVRARHLLDMYGASRSRDIYAAFEDTFIVDLWSAFQITFMCAVGMLQVYMIKKLFNKSTKNVHSFY